MTNRFNYAIIVVVLSVVVVSVLTLVLTRLVDFAPAPQISAVSPASAPGSASIDGPQTQGAVYNPPRPEDAPADLRDAVMLGYNIVTDTHKFAADYVGNQLTCANCHFSGGISQGGKNGGLSLVGVAAKYPQYRQRQQYAVDLVTRVNDCFQRSENGKTVPPGAKEMQALIAYFHWISKDIPIYAAVPWSSLAPVKSDHKPDLAAGTLAYGQACSACHGADGAGTAAAPPLWGDRSYNDGAGMAKPQTLAAFAHLNMPRGNPNLTAEQALDIAEFVDTQPRPRFKQS